MRELAGNVGQTVVEHEVEKSHVHKEAAKPLLPQTEAQPIAKFLVLFGIVIVILGLLIAFFVIQVGIMIIFFGSLPIVIAVFAIERKKHRSPRA